MSNKRRNIRITLALCLLWVAVVLVVTYFRYADNNAAAGRDTTALSAEELREVGARVYEEPIELKDFRLRSHQGEAFTPDSFEGQWDLVFFGFTNCPDICPLTMRELAGFYRQLDDTSDVRVIMVSVDPFRDDAEQVGEYVQGFHEDFLGVTGELEQIGNLASQLYVAHSTPPPETGSDYLVDHSGNILLVNPQGEYHGFMESGIRGDDILQAFQAIRAAY